MSEFVEVNTNELTGRALDWSVAMAEGWSPDRPQDGQIKSEYRHLLVGKPPIWRDLNDHYAPSTEWAHGGPLMEEYKPWMSPPVNDPDPTQAYGWDAEIYDAAGYEVIGRAEGCPSALVALCRAIVFAKFGSAVQVPAALMQEAPHG